MTFVKETTSALASIKPNAQVGVLQFSNDCRDEVALGAIDDMEAFQRAVDNVVCCVSWCCMVGSVGFRVGVTMCLDVPRWCAKVGGEHHQQ